jgi:hypothetical membrane protein
MELTAKSAKLISRIFLVLGILFLCLALFSIYSEGRNPDVESSISTVFIALSGSMAFMAWGYFTNSAKRKKIEESKGI